jgi:hypothetical protein
MHENSRFAGSHSLPKVAEPCAVQFSSLRKVHYLVLAVVVQGFLPDCLVVVTLFRNEQPYVQPPGGTLQ